MSFLPPGNVCRRENNWLLPVPSTTPPTPPSYDVTMLLHCDDAVALTLTDSSTYNNSGWFFGADGPSCLAGGYFDRGAYGGGALLDTSAIQSGLDILTVGSGNQSTIEFFFKDTGYLGVSDPLFSPYLMFFDAIPGLIQNAVSVFQAGGFVLLDIYAAGVISGSANLSALDGAWHYYMLQFDGLDVHVYRDNASIGTITLSLDFNAPLTWMQVFGGFDSSSGVIDEVRIVRNEIVSFAGVPAAPFPDP